MLDPIAPTSAEAAAVLAEERPITAGTPRIAQSVCADFDIVVGGKRHLIKANRSQIFDLLMASCERVAELEEQVRELQAENVTLKRAASAKDEFLAKVSHELRSPLTPIQGALAILKCGKVAPLPEKLEEMVDLANRNCVRLMSIVNDLLDFARIGTGRFSLNRATIELEPVLEQVLQNKRIEANAPDINFQIAPGAKGVKLEADPIRIQQVLDNLLSNAMKFADPAGHIAVNVERRKGSLRVCVADDGPGIPRDFQDQVFDAFAQAESSANRRQGGVGLGLAICKSIVEAHGGRIGLISKEGEGTTFYFDLPLSPA
jgi:signal transduction histidine kinase